MESINNAQIVGVRFSKVGKLYHFSAGMINDLKVGDVVVVETSRGWQLGQVAQLSSSSEHIGENLKAIDRRATPRDLVLRQMWQTREAEVVETAKKRAAELNLNLIKIVNAEYSFDGSRLAVLFSTETEEKVELKSLRGDMQRAFAPAQVELRQIGPRDVAKMLCGMGACGLETRCCSRFLTEFSSISIRMAKEQGISLTPTEITGMCGRLRCCLIYEYDQYVEARAGLPKKNKRVFTPEGEARVLDVAPIRQGVIVALVDGPVREFHIDKITLLEEGEPLPPLPIEEKQPLFPDEPPPYTPRQEAPRRPDDRQRTQAPQQAEEGRRGGQPPRQPGSQPRKAPPAPVNQGQTRGSIGKGPGPGGDKRWKPNRRRPKGGPKSGEDSSTSTE
jgi:cell fate regulator YaaT (PSP1 superfamily)